MIERGNLDDPKHKWLHGKPDYSVVNLEYLKNRTQSHAADSLEKIVENLVKTWEMETQHKDSTYFLARILSKFIFRCKNEDF